MKRTAYSDESFKIYLKQIQSKPLLTRKEEIKLTERKNKGDKEAVKKLTEGNLRLVVYVAKRFFNCGLDFMDLIGEGNDGLLKAVEKYKLGHGTRFSSYAVPWIEQSMIRGIARKGKTIRLPDNLNLDVLKAKKISREFIQKFGKKPHAKEIARRMKISESKAKKLLGLDSKIISLDQPVMNKNEENNEGKLLSDFIEDKLAINPFDMANYKVDHENWGKWLKKNLNEKEEFVIRERYGFNDGIPKVLNEIGSKMNVTREMVRLIQEKALEKIRRAFLRNRYIPHNLF